MEFIDALMCCANGPQLLNIDTRHEIFSSPKHRALRRSNPPEPTSSSLKARDTHGDSRHSRGVDQAQQRIRWKVAAVRSNAGDECSSGFLEDVPTVCEPSNAKTAARTPAEEIKAVVNTPTKGNSSPHTQVFTTQLLQAMPSQACIDIDLEASSEQIAERDELEAGTEEVERDKFRAFRTLDAMLREAGENVERSTVRTVDRNSPGLLNKRSATINLQYGRDASSLGSVTPIRPAQRKCSKSPVSGTKRRQEAFTAREKERATVLTPSLHSDFTFCPCVVRPDLAEQYRLEADLAMSLARAKTYLRNKTVPPTTPYKVLGDPINPSVSNLSTMKSVKFDIDSPIKDSQA